MNRAEAAELLAFCAGNDQRTTGQTDVLIWHGMLEPIPFDRARDAAVRHYRQNPDVRLKPGHLWRMCSTTTDISRGDTVAPALPDGTRLCGDCKGVHRPDEPCNILVADDKRWRRALDFGKRPPDPLPGDYGDEHRRPPPALPASADAEALERERRRQLDAMQARMDGTGPDES